MDTKKIYSWLGLSMRAGRLVSGEDTTLSEVKKKRTKLVIISEDASNNTKKLFNDKCSYRDIEFVIFGTKAEIGNSIGKSPRAVVGILDENIAKEIKKIIEKDLG